MRVRSLCVNMPLEASPAVRPHPGGVPDAEADVALPAGSCRSFVRLLNALGLSACRGWAHMAGVLVAFTVHSLVGLF